jgi:hypothetical protein
MFLLGHVFGGVCMTGGIIVQIAVKLEETKVNLLESLLIMDGLGLSTIAIGAMFYHYMTEQGPTPMMILFIFPILRLGYNDWKLPEGFKPLAAAFGIVCVVGLLGAIGWASYNF